MSRQIYAVCLKCFFSLMLLLPIEIPAPAQSADRAGMNGIVQDTSDARIPNASLKIINTDTGQEINSKTNHEGNFFLPGLLPGHYTLQIDRDGFDTTQLTGITLDVGANKSVVIRMKVGSAMQTVSVDGSGTTVNTIDGSVSTVIDRRFVENAPLNGRSFQDLISLTPGVVTQSPQSGSSVGLNGDFSVNGQRTESNYYAVDGVTGNVGAGNGYGTGQPGSGGTIAAATALGTTQSLISVDALQEFRVQSSSYSAEYGHGPGGQFSLVTRSGTDELHGSVFDYLRNNFFDANDWFNDLYGKPVSALRQNDFGATVGGPIYIPHAYDGKGRTFFFASYEGLRLTQPQAASIQYVPDSFMRQQAPTQLQSILNAFPVQDGVDYGTATSPSLAQFIAPSSQPSAIDSTSVRFDDSVSPKLRLFFRFGDTPSSTTSRTLSALTHTDVNTLTYTLGVTSQFSANAVNEFRLGYSQGTSTVTGALDGFGGAVPIDLSSALGTGSTENPQPLFDLQFQDLGISQLTFPNSSNALHQWDTNDVLTVQSGHHTLKFGFDYRRINSQLTPSSVEAAVYYDSPPSVLTNQADLLFLIKSLSATPIFNDTAAFAQDEWQVNPRLHLALGLRWEVNPPPSEAHGNDAYTLLGSLADPSSLTLAPQGTPLWGTTYYNFSPRLGVAWTAHENANTETVFRAGGGVFFDSSNEVATDGYSGIGFAAYNLVFGAVLPATPAELNFGTSATPPYTGSTVFAFPPHLQLPYTLQWNVSLEQALGRSQSLTLSYVGADGRRLSALQQASLGTLNPNFGTVEYFLNDLTSNYQALQVKFQRSVTRGIQVLASYTWAHSIDFGSNSSALPVLRGDSDFDVRNNFQAGGSWELPSSRNRAVGLFSNDWGIDARVMSRTGFPVTLNGNFQTDPATGSQYYGNLDLVPGEPLYLYGHQYPGGRIINQAAFSLPATGNGDAPRNFIRGFGATQMNLAARRSFPIGDKVKLQFRAEAFNLLNHPNFGFIDANYGDLLFGQATQMLNQSLGTVAAQYQQGGPRSMQFALKLKF